MTARPFFAKLAAFFFAFAFAVAAVAGLRALRPARPGFTWVRVPSPFRLTKDLGFEVGLVTLDHENARSYTRLTFNSFHRDTPDKLWVRTYFFSPDDPQGRVWADDAVEIDAQYGESTFTLAAPCGWCDDEGVPPSGYFARVQIWDGREMTPLPEGEEFVDIKTAVPVVVHAERPPVLRP